MLLIRFKANEEDSRPIFWPVKHPFWCSGYGEDYSIVISYANDENYIYENWPEAKDLEIEEVNSYVFTERFPKPKWFDEDKEKLEESPISYFDFMPHGECLIIPWPYHPVGEYKMKIYGIRQNIHPSRYSDETLTEIQVVLETEFWNKATIEWHRANQSPTFELQQSPAKQHQFVDFASDLADLIARVKELMEVKNPVSHFEWIFEEGDILIMAEEEDD